MKFVIFSGAGLSAESGIKTFRVADGLWKSDSVQRCDLVNEVRNE